MTCRVEAKCRTAKPCNIRRILHGRLRQKVAPSSPRQFKAISFLLRAKMLSAPGIRQLHKYGIRNVHEYESNSDSLVRFGLATMFYINPLSRTDYTPNYVSL